MPLARNLVVRKKPEYEALADRQARRWWCREKAKQRRAQRKLSSSGS